MRTATSLRRNRTGPRSPGSVSAEGSAASTFRDLVLGSVAGACETSRMVPDEVVAFGGAVAECLRGQIGVSVVGAYFVGSIALGGYVPGESDVDIVAVCDLAIPDEMKSSIADAIVDTTVSCPARGLEFTLYRREIVASAPVAAD